MNPYSKVVSNVLFPLHERIKGHSTIRVHKEMERSQWLSPHEIQDLQIERLRTFFCDIRSHVPYYRELFSALDFKPEELESLADLQKLPTMGKAEIRQNTDKMKAENVGGLQRFNTGGSSGEPLIFYLGKKRISHDVAAKRRATRWWNVDIGDPEIVVWGSPIELGSQDRVRQLRDKLFRSELLSAFEMSERNLDSFIRSIVKKKPKMLFGYPSSLAHIAKHAQSLGVNLDNLGIRVAFVTSERLYDHQRTQIETVFGCPVANGYGGRDAGFIAHECPHGSMHITADDIVVETVNSDGTTALPGEAGEIVVTHMATNQFPFVRYRTGDVGVIDGTGCACGRGLPVLSDLQGRTTDFLVAADGTIMHGLALIYVMRDLEGVREFKIIQESVEHVRVLVIPDGQWGENLVDVITEGFKARLGSDVQVTVDITSNIEAEASGKKRYVVSHVAPSTGAGL